jgi:hypothetical protein
MHPLHHPVAAAVDALHSMSLPTDREEGIGKRATQKHRLKSHCTATPSSPSIPSTTNFDSLIEIFPDKKAKNVS